MGERLIFHGAGPASGTILVTTQRDCTLVTLRLKASFYDAVKWKPAAGPRGWSGRGCPDLGGGEVRRCCSLNFSRWSGGGGAGEEERKCELGESWVFFKGGLVLSGKEFYGKNWEMSHLPDRWSITRQIVFFWGSRHYPRGFPGFVWHQWAPLKTLLWNWIPFQHIWLSQLLPVSESYMHEDALSVELFTFRLFRFGFLAYPKTRLSHYSLPYSLFKNKLTTQR